MLISIRRARIKLAAWGTWYARGGKVKIEGVRKFQLHRGLNENRRLEIWCADL